LPSHGGAPTPGSARPTGSLAGIERLREEREDVNRSLLRSEEERGKLQHELRRIQERLTEINEGSAKEAAYRDELDTMIRESEDAFMKILESSQTLLSVVRREQQSMKTRLGDAPEAYGSASGVSFQPSFSPSPARPGGAASASSSGW